MTNEGKPVTIASMASFLGVSTATVAKALHGQGRISPAMIEKVRALAKKWRYIPNQAARSLRTRSNDTVGLLVTSDINSPWYGSFISHLEDELSSHNLTLTLALGKYDVDKARYAIDQIFSGRVCGIIAGPILDQAHLEQLCDVSALPVPIVTFGNIQKTHTHFVALDQKRGAEIAFNHMYQLGHRRIAFIASGDIGNMSPDNGTRHGSYLSFVKKHNLQMDYIRIASGSFLRHNAFHAIQALLCSRRNMPLPTAFVCHNDDVALGTMMAIQQHGCKIPEDFSVIGFDDIEEGSFSLPPLTTIGGVMENVTRELVKTLLQVLLHKPSQHFQQYIIPELIERSSTTTPREN